MATAGVGTKLERFGSSAWESMTEVTSIDGPSATREVIDVTALDTVGGYREFIPSFRDGGTLTLNMNYTRASFTILKGDFDLDGDAAEKNYSIVLNDNTDNKKKTCFWFRGFVNELPVSIQTDDKVMLNTSIKIIGKIYYGTLGPLGGIAGLPDRPANPNTLLNLGTYTNQSFARNSAITSATLPAASGGATPYVYALNGIDSITGLVFTASTRVLSGTPTATAGVYNVVYSVTDGIGDTFNRPFTITLT